MKLVGIKLKMWHVLRESALIRDDYRCQVCHKRKNLQVDHCFSRNNSILFFELKNLTTLCDKCHNQKTFKWYGVEKDVDAVVIEREGRDWFKWAKKESRKTFHWTKYLLEEKKRLLEEELTSHEK